MNSSTSHHMTALAVFIHNLMRDTVPAGDLENMVRCAEGTMRFEGGKFAFANPHLGAYAKELAARLVPTVDEPAACRKRCTCGEPCAWQVCRPERGPCRCRSWLEDKKCAGDYLSPGVLRLIPGDIQWRVFLAYLNDRWMHHIGAPLRNGKRYGSPWIEYAGVPVTKCCDAFWLVGEIAGKTDGDESETRCVPKT